jgi:hypothetical protein
MSLLPAGAGERLILLVLMGGVALLMVVPTIILWGFAGHLRAFSRGRAERLALAMRSARFLWICMTVWYGLSLLTSIGQLALHLAGIDLTRTMTGAAGLPPPPAP